MLDLMKTITRWLRERRATKLERGIAAERVRSQAIEDPRFRAQVLDWIAIDERRLKALRGTEQE